MAPKKKGKANKLAKMSDEEKARYLQHRADIEEEARRRKQELISRYMKNKLHKEEIFTKVNLAKINQQWRFILRKLKVKQLDQELQMMIISFTRMADSKNAVIARLMTYLDEAEDQYSRMLQSHMEMINQFLETSGERLKFFHNNFEEQKYAIIEQWEEESQNMESNQKDSEYNLQLIMYQQDDTIDKQLKSAEDVNAHSANHIIILMEQDLIDMKRPKELQLELMWNEMKEVFTKYVNYHSPKIQQYQSLRQKDSMYRRNINQHMEKLLAASDLILHYQNEWENLSEEIDIKQKSTHKKKESMSKMYSEGKLKMFNHHIKDEEQMTVLSVESSEAIQKLESLVLKGEKILQMELTCKKYETDSEKVLPWDNLTVSFDMNNANSDMLDTIEAYDMLENFWFKLNRVNIHSTALRAERDSLRQENKHLKTCLKNYLMEAALGDGKGVATEVSGRPASMRMYRIAPLSGGNREVAKVMRRPVTCVEASICNAVQHERRINQWKKNSINNIVIRRHCQ